MRWDMKRILHNDTSHQIAVNYAGEAGTGKSVLLSLLYYLCSGSVDELSYRDLDNRFHISRFEGKKLIIVDEIPIDRLNEGMLEVIKKAISGGMLTGEIKSSFIYTFKSRCIVVFAGNIPAQLDSRLNRKDPGISRRIMIVPVEFPLSGGTKTGMLERLKDKIGSIISWVHGLPDSFDPSQRAEEVSRALLSQMESGTQDPVLEWLLSRCKHSQNASTALGLKSNDPSTLHGDFTLYMQANYPKKDVPKEFTTGLRKALDAVGENYEKMNVRWGKGNHLRGITLTSNRKESGRSYKVIESEAMIKLAHHEIFTTYREGEGIVKFSTPRYKSNEDVIARRRSMRAKYGMGFEIKEKPKIDYVDIGAVKRESREVDFKENEENWERGLMEAIDDQEVIL